MRHPVIAGLAVLAALVLGGCENTGEPSVERAVQSVNALDGNGLNEVMMAAADPEEAVSYFERATHEKPDRMDLKRGLGKSLIRAGRPDEAAGVWAGIAGSGSAVTSDRVAYAGALIRAGKWDKATRIVEALPDGHESYRRYRLEAMIADSEKDWPRADRLYRAARRLTETPAGLLNNWGYSKLQRGDYAGAEKLFGEALHDDPSLFTAKNNLAMARAAQREYELPLIPMSEEERAEMLHTMGLAAIKQGDVEIGRGLMQDAVEAHPRYFETAARTLAALEGGTLAD